MSSQITAEDLKTLGDLKARVKEWMAETTILDPQLDLLVSRAEQFMNRKLRIDLMQKNSGPLTANVDGEVDLPADFLAAFNVLHLSNPHVVLKPATLSYNDWRYPSGSGYTSNYTVVGKKLYTFVPATSPVEVDYFGRITPLTDDAPSNDILETYSDLYMNATIAQAALFRQKWDMAKAYAQVATDQIEELNDQYMAHLNRGGMRASRITP